VCIESGQIALSVVEVTAATASAHVSAVRQLREGFPSIPVLAYCDPVNSSSAVIVDVVRAGATGLVLRGIDDSKALFRETIIRARRRAIAERIFVELAPMLTSDARLFLRYAIEHCAVDVSVDEAADELGVDRKTLTNWLARAGAPRAREFLSWIRLIVAAHLLSDPRRTAENVALHLDFPSGTSLRNMVRRYVNVTTAELQQGDGAALVLEAFKRQIRAWPVARLTTERTLESGRGDTPRSEDAGPIEVPA
jgi:AraC-like DNA-binding protein